jgi:hypothetical protein
MAKKKKTEVALDEAVEKLESVETSEEVEAEAPAEEEVETEVETEVEAEAPAEEEVEAEAPAEEEVEAEAPAEEKETVIPEPAFVENGDTEVESFNHKSVTIKGKTYAIDRATHKALVAGDFSVLKDIKK